MPFIATILCAFAVTVAGLGALIMLVLIADSVLTAFGWKGAAGAAAFMALWASVWFLLRDLGMFTA